MSNQSVGLGSSDCGSVADPFSVSDDEVGGAWAAVTLLVAEAGGAEAVASDGFEEAATAEVPCAVTRAVRFHRALVAPATNAATV